MTFILLDDFQVRTQARSHSQSSCELLSFLRLSLCLGSFFLSQPTLLE